MIQIINRLNETIGKFVSWLNPLLVALVTVNVVFRYCFSESFAWMKEMEWHLFSVIFLLGAGYTFKHDHHVRVDVFYQRLGRRTRAAIDFFGCLLFLFPSCFLVIWSSVSFVEMSWAFRETSPDPGGMGMRYLIKGCLPVGFFLVALQGVAVTMKKFLILTGREKKR